jgi:cytochrome c551/c552
MLPNGDFDKMEPFFPSLKVNSLIDMEVGPDGKLYLLEYGNGWFTKNVDAGLARIDFNSGNRPPVIASIKTDKSTGVLPFAVKISVDAKDLEKDKITYKWNLGNGTTKETTEPTLDYTYTAAGDYIITVEAKDDKGAASTSNEARVYAGNETPTVTIDITGGNKSFYLPGLPVQYAVNVADKTDTAKFDLANLYVSVDYVEGFDKAASTMGHQQGQAAISGKSLTQSLDCKSCHKEADKSVGPAFIEVSRKYAKDPNAMTYLTQKIIKGGSGVWGQVAMAAHPTLSQDDIHQILNWVLSLSNNTAAKKSLPQTGTIVPPANGKPNSVLVLSASYTDKGGNNIKALTGTNTVALNSNTVTFTGTEKLKSFTATKYGGNNLMRLPAAEGWVELDNIDLTGVHSVQLNCGAQIAPKKGLLFEIRLDAPDGKLISKGGTTAPPAKGGTMQTSTVKLPLEAVNDGKQHSVYIVYKPQEKLQGVMVSVQFSN